MMTISVFPQGKCWMRVKSPFLKSSSVLAEKRGKLIKNRLRKRKTEHFFTLNSGTWRTNKKMECCFSEICSIGIFLPGAPFGVGSEPIATVISREENGYFQTATDSAKL